MVSDTLDKFKSVRGPRSCGTLSIRGKGRGGLIEKLENLNTLVKTNGEGRAKEEDKGGAKCESSISMGTFAFRLNFWRSTLLFDICLSSANTPQTIRFLSLSLSRYTILFIFFDHWQGVRDLRKAFKFYYQKVLQHQNFDRISELEDLALLWVEPDSRIVSLLAHVCNNSRWHFQSSLDSAGIIFYNGKGQRVVPSVLHW